jgi:lipopolysaccharide/colanic/teichoic acid biosynthesis glycosyltransferase
MTAAVRAPERTQAPTIWGCTPQEVHDRFWAAFGVQVVRRGSRAEIAADSELFLLVEPGTLVLFRLTQILSTLYWLAPRLLVLRVRDARPRAYRETAVTEHDRLVRFERVYRDARARSVRVALTPDAALARSWRDLAEGPAPWRRLRSRVASERRAARVVSAQVYDGRDGAQTMECVRDMMRGWARPDVAIRRAHRIRPSILVDATARIDASAVLRGPVWVGAGRAVDAATRVVGPAVLWDDPAWKPAADDLAPSEIEPTSLAPGVSTHVRPRFVPGKRAFDVAFSVTALALTAPLYPLIAAAILVEDGGPVFFAHRRETVGGREFPCLKFRSMGKQADTAKKDLARRNQCDGPQFFIPDDPRVTRVGRLIRKLHLDELPQFFNVLAGHMSVVGPRPSPYRENQYCPAWREARLSVRPGVTGLWQVSRTRKKGLDFQEWIRFDLEYVENASWALDLRIIAKTVVRVATGGGT